MSDSFEQASVTIDLSKQVCRVAYTLNNAQPVICTIIGDQPLHYMDYDGDFEEEDGLPDLADIDLLEEEISHLRDEITALERFSSARAPGGKDLPAAFRANGGSLCERTGRDGGDAEILQKLLAVLGQSRLAAAYLNHCAAYKTALVLSRQVPDAAYDRRAGKILLNPDVEFHMLALLAVRELRRHWQHRQGALIHPLLFQPDNAVLVGRLQAADLAVSMIRAAWELQLAGIREIWDLVEYSPMADLGRALAREAFLDFRTLNNGMAAASVFESWFLSDRCRAQDKKLIQQMLADYQGYVFNTEAVSQNVTAELIAALGTMPFGKNYLAVHAATIMNDPIFTDVRDRSNANFLWFIKFERSFRETEQELHSPVDNSTAGVLPGDHSKENQGKDYADIQTAEVVTLYDAASNHPSLKKPGAGLLRKKRKEGGDSQESGAEIIYLRRGFFD